MEDSEDLSDNLRCGKKPKKSHRSYTKTPVWICEYHQEVLPHIYRSISAKYLPFCGITLLHFDSHPDLMAPVDFKADDVYEKSLLFDVISIADWILPAVYAGHINKVIWVKPPWCEQIKDKTVVCHVGRSKLDQTIRISSFEKYFCEDGIYSALEDLENTKELTVCVVTMHFGPGDNKQENIEDYNKHSTMLDSSEESKKVGSDLSYFKILVNMLSTQIQQPYILDIDMDFFSTLNPFRAMFTETQFQTLRSFYLFPVCRAEDAMDMKRAMTEHARNLERLQATLEYLKNDEGCNNVDHNFVNIKYLEFIRNWRDSQPGPADYDMVHSAGTTTELPVHITEEQEIKQMIYCFGTTLKSLPAPTIITVARSSDDDYTPPQSVEFIQESLIKCLEEIYKDITIFHAYKGE